MGIIRTLAVLGSAVVFFIAAGGPAFAHEAWFVEHGEHDGHYFTLDWLTVLIGLGAVLFIASAVVVHRSAWSRRLRDMAERGQRRLPPGAEWRVVAALSGAMLVATRSWGCSWPPTWSCRAAAW